MLPRIPAQPQDKHGGSVRLCPTAAGSRGPRVPGYGQHALPRPPRSEAAPGLFPLCGATPQPRAAGGKILTAAPGRLPMEEMSRGARDQHGKCWVLGENKRNLGCTARLQRGWRCLLTTSFSCRDEEGTSPIPKAGGGHGRRRLQLHGLQADLKTERAGELAETQASPGGQSRLLRRA